MPPTKLQAHGRNCSSSSSHFLCLPAELRVAIYEYTLEVATVTQLKVSIHADKYASADTGRLVLHYSKQPQFCPDLTVFRASRQIYTEALPVLYKRCVFCPMADVEIISKFFGQMSDFARSNIFKLHLTPRPQKIVRLASSRANLSQVVYGPSWGPVCEKVFLFFVALGELCIHLHPSYAHDLGRGDRIDWIIRPLSRLRGMKKTLASVGDTYEEFEALKLIHNWNELVKKADCELEEYMASRQRILSSQNGWSMPYWMTKRNKLLES